VKFFSKSRDVRRFGIGDQFKNYFNATWASQNRDPQRRTRSISPSVRNPFAEGHDIADLTIEYLVAVRDPRSPFQDGNMFVLSLMNMHRRTIAGVRHDFD
jgi:hypothetical protein